MSNKPLEIYTELDENRDELAKAISNRWDTFHQQRREWLDEKQELRDFIFATDTTKTSGSRLPWRNTTIIPKIAQIRDNLHANYMGALFPNDDWQRWEAYSEDDAEKQKRDVIQSYISNKARESNLRDTVSSLIYDYIDWGNAFAEVVYENDVVGLDDGESVTRYIGPRVLRISPFDIVFNPLASDFSHTWKIVRYVKTMGEIELLAEQEGDMQEAWQNILTRRKDVLTKLGGYSKEDWQKANAYQVDGFGNLFDYYQSGFMEILRFEGDIYDGSTLLTNTRIIVVDRSYVVSKEKIPSWLGSDSIVHVGWRKRPDNLYGMGPLDNLVGMQYRLNHLENSKADALDQFILPPKIIKGEVEDFDWGPDCEIHLDENASVEVLRPEMSAIIDTRNEMAALMQLMEEFAGAPREAMGIRTPGEKTAFEIQSLQNAAGRIFQDKVSNFEINMLEPLLNAMLEVARRNMETGDVVRIMDDDIGVIDFVSITKDDITAKGKIRPIGARHFAARAQMIQNLTGIANTPIWGQIAPHVSSKQLAKTVEDLLQFNRHNLVSENIAVSEQMETQSMVQEAQTQLTSQQMAAAEEGV